MKIIHKLIALALISFTIACNGGKKKPEPVNDANETPNNLIENDTEITKETNYIIEPNGFMGMEIGDLIRSHSNNLKISTIKTGEGSFEVHQIINAQGKDIGMVVPSPSDPSKIGTIEITDANYKTDKGIGVGDMYGALKRAYPNIATHGSEVESRTTSSINGLSFLLDAYFNTYEINETLLSPDAKIKRVIITGASKMASVVTSPANLKYICYNSDNDSSNKIWIAFGEGERALRVKYKGQKEFMTLVHKNEEFKKGGAYPTIINYYDEIYNGNVNGTYKLTKSGIWYYVTYTRGKDGKVFKFTIDQTKTPFSRNPCF